MESSAGDTADGRILTRQELDELLRAHLATLRSYVRLRAGPLLRAREPVSDLVQSALREILEHAATFRFTSEAAFRRWVHTIAMHKVVSKSRFHASTKRDPARAKFLASGVFDVPERGGSSRAASPSRLAAHAEDLERLARALDELDENDREIVCMRRIFGLPPGEIATTLGVAESTVRWRLSQAMTKLADRLA